MWEYVWLGDDRMDIFKDHIGEALVVGNNGKPYKRRYFLD